MMVYAIHLLEVDQAIVCTTRGKHLTRLYSVAVRDSVSDACLNVAPLAATDEWRPVRTWSSWKDGV